MTKLYIDYSVTEFKRTCFNYFRSITCIACCVFFFSFTFFILTQTWKIVVYKLASCAAILFIYVHSQSGLATPFHLFLYNKYMLSTEKEIRTVGY
jgi:hypothetical protein